LRSSGVLDGHKTSAIRGNIDFLKLHTVQPLLEIYKLVQIRQIRRDSFFTFNPRGAILASSTTKDEIMFEALRGIACFVTVTVSLIYGTRIAWVCGKKCDFKEKPENKKHALFESVPAAAVVYTFGFLIVFSLFLDGFLTILTSSLTSAILLSGFVVSMAMPELKRKPALKR